MGMTESVKEDATYEALVDERSSWSRDIRQHIENGTIWFYFVSMLNYTVSDLKSMHWAV